MFKSFFFFLIVYFFSTYAIYAENNSNKIKITANKIEATKAFVIAHNNVVVYYKGAVIKANSAEYNKEKKLLILDGYIEIIGYHGSKLHTQHMEIFTEKEEVTFDELFFVSKNDVWFYSQNIHKFDANYTLGMSLLSSCEMTNPLWTMVFKHSLYDSDTKYMKVYDAKVYFWDIPVFYSPYLAFSTNKERSSGLLFPGIGYSDLEGFLYEQPIYWAISPNMDIEINPQIRTSRSVGLYGTLRFADTAYSKGEFRIGYFKDKESYVKQEDLPNNSHYGFEFNYESSKLFSSYYPKDFQDGLYVNITYLSDIDYINLQQSKLGHFGLTPLQESRINYFTYNNDYYAGLNAKYFIDTRENVDDDKTLQILPAIQMHKFLNSILWDNLTYSADISFENFDRKVGTTMRQVELKIPLEFTTSFFNNLLNLSLEEEFYYSKFFFGNADYKYNNYKYFSNIHKIKIFTDLTKQYNEYIHVLQPSLKYIKPGSEKESPVKFALLDDEQRALFTIGLPKEQFEFSLSQYFYDNQMNLKFYQRFSQKYYLNKGYKLADMTNEMQYNWKKWSFYNNFIYAYEFSKIRESSSRIFLNESSYYMSLGHTYKNVLPDFPNTIAGNDVDFTFRYTYNNKIDFSGGLTYNIEQASSKQWRIGGKYHIDCWSLSASLRQDITPRPSGFTTNNTFYIQFNFTPFGSIGSGDIQ